MEWYWQGKAYFSEKNLSQCHPVHHKSPCGLAWAWTQAALVTNCLSLDTTTFEGPLFTSSPYHQLHWLEPLVILPSPSKQMPVYDLDWATASFHIFTSSSFNTGKPSVMTALLNNPWIKFSYFILTLKAGCWVFTNSQTIKCNLDLDTPFLGSLLELFCSVQYPSKPQL